MDNRKPVPDTYAEVVLGPSRDSDDRWERRRWWVRASTMAIAFLVGLIVIQLAERAGIPGSSAVAKAPVALVDPIALLLGLALFWVGRGRWPLSAAAGLLESVVDRVVR